MSESYEVVVESNDPDVTSRLIVRADTVQQLHDRLTSVVDAASFTLIGAATAAMRTEVQAHRVLGAHLDARPDNPPVEAPTAPPEPSTPASPPPTNSPWDADQSASTDGPNLPPPSTPPASPAPASGLPPMPKWAQ